MNFRRYEGASEPTAAELEEAWLLARKLGRLLALHHFGDPECYTLIFNAARTRRMPWFHVHILPAQTPAAKRWAMLCLSLKRQLRWCRWPVVRALLEKLSRSAEHRKSVVPEVRGTL